MHRGDIIPIDQNKLKAVQFVRVLLEVPNINPVDTKRAAAIDNTQSKGYHA